ALGKFAVICEEKQSFALCVQTPDVEQPRELCWQQIENSVADVRISAGRNESGGLMQHDREWRGYTNKFAIYLDVITRPRLRAEVGADLAIDRDATRRDQFIAVTPRCDAGGGEIAVEAQENVTRLQMLHRYNGSRPCNFVTVLTADVARETLYTSGFVLGSPMTFWPSFHWPRFFRSSTRSKRFNTLRLAAMVPVRFKLRCCDMTGLKC